MVSGTKRRVKVIEIKPMTAKMMNVVCRPKLASNVGKNKPITKFVTQTNKTQSPMP